MSTIALKLKYSKNVISPKVQDEQENSIVANTKTDLSNIDWPCNLDDLCISNVTQTYSEDLAAKDAFRNFEKQKLYNDEVLHLKKQLELQQATILSQESQIRQLNIALQSCREEAEKYKQKSQDMTKLNIADNQLRSIKMMFLGRSGSFDELYHTLHTVKEELDAFKEQQRRTVQTDKQVMGLKTSLESTKTMVHDLEHDLSMESARNTKAQKEFNCAMQNVSIIRNNLQMHFEEISKITEVFIDTCSKFGDTVLKNLEN